VRPALSRSAHALGSALSRPRTRCVLPLVLTLERLDPQAVRKSLIQALFFFY